MNGLKFIAREAAEEFRAALKGGIPLLIFLGLTGYILLMLTSSGYLRDLNAADVPRNSPALAYLFFAGNCFFLFFAWAWVFAQPIVRDRNAHLHEIVFTSPLSLKRLLLARFLGALGVALLVGAAQFFGFLVAPLLETFGIVPAGSMAATPFAALAWGYLILVVPIAIGSGALYFAAAIWTRSASGPFAASAILILAWMFAIIVVRESAAGLAAATIADPSMFSGVDFVVGQWTPLEKATALYPLNGDFLLNRLVWSAAPLLVLAYAISTASREKLVLEHEPKKAPARKIEVAVSRAPVPPLEGARAQNWFKATLAECAWQIERVVRSQTTWICFGALVALGVVGVFYHMLANADGPIEPRPQNMPPILSTLLFLFIAFIVAAAAGFIMRRDEREGFADMMDAAPAPVFVRQIGRATAVLTISALLGLIPGVSSILAQLILAPEALDLMTPIQHQVLITVPAILELAALAMVTHAVVRQSGPAYAASMFIVFAALVNHETEIVTYPPLQFAIPLPIELSRLTGWSLSLERVLYGDALKLVYILALVLIAIASVPRGVESRFAYGARQVRERLTPALGAVALALVVAGAGLFSVQDNRYIAEGGYETRAQDLAMHAGWEREWLARASAYSVSGGELTLDVSTGERLVHGVWRIKGVRAETLHFELEHGMNVTSARVNGAEAPFDVAFEHAAIPVPQCVDGGCEVELRWTVQLLGWDSDGEVPWLSEQGSWLSAERMAPKMGIDIDRVLRVPAEREDEGLNAEIAWPVREARSPISGVAPSGDWSWSVVVDRGEPIQGQTGGVLDFAMAASPHLQAQTSDGLTLLIDDSRGRIAETIADDVRSMSACVSRRMGLNVNLQAISELPRGMLVSGHCGFGANCPIDRGASRLAGGHLLLSEAPYWEVADEGMGRNLRQYAIARLLARDAAVNAGDLRQGDGAQWVSNGLAGAVALLCVGDVNGVDSLRAMLTRGADEASQGLASSPIPVGAVRDGPSDGWVADYTPLASVSRVASLEPASIAAMLQKARDGGDVQAAVASVLGETVTVQLMGQPRASDVSLRAAGQAYDVRVRRWVWERGGWEAVSDRTDMLSIIGMGAGALVAETVDVAAAADVDGAHQSIVIDGAVSYERAPADNVLTR